MEVWVGVGTWTLPKIWHLGTNTRQAALAHDTHGHWPSTVDCRSPPQMMASDRHILSS